MRGGALLGDRMPLYSRPRTPAHLLIGVTMLIMVSSCNTRQDGKGDGVCRNAEYFLNTIVAEPPVVVRADPGGTHLLLRRTLADGAELIAVDRGTGRPSAAVREAESPVAAAWSADGRYVAFLMDRGGNQKFRLYVWDILSGITRRLPGPATTTSRGIKWSPLGTHLAYIRRDGVGRPHDVVVVDASDGAARYGVVAQDVLRDADIEWSPDGGAIAVVPRARAGAVLIVGFPSGTRRVLEVGRGGEVRDVAWSPDGREMTATYRGPRDEFFGLVTIELSSGDVSRRRERLTTDIADPLYDRHGRWLVYHKVVNAEMQVVVCRRSGAGCEAVVGGFGMTTALGFNAAGDSLIVLDASPVMPSGLLVVSLSDLGYVTSLQRHSSDGVRHLPRHRRADIAAPDGRRIPTYVWERRSESGHRGVIIRIHGGPAAHFGPAWDRSTQIMLDAGFSVLMPNYRGSTGYGRSHERPADFSGQVADIHAAIRYTMDAMETPGDQIVLYGHSYGAMVAAFAARTYPARLHTVVLISTPRWPRGPNHWASRPARVLAYQGQNDIGLGPAAAKEQIRELFVRNGETDVEFRAVPRVGHSFSAARAQAQTYAQALCMR